MLSANFKNRLSLMYDYINRNPSPKAYPNCAVIEPTTRCNLECPMCARTLKKQGDFDMTMGTFIEVVEQLKDNIELVFLYGLGEPLLNANIFDMVKHCSNYNIATQISTNATIMDEKTIEELWNSGLDTIIFAFDGATKNTYEFYKKGSKFEETKNNIERFLKYPKRQNSKLFSIIQMVLYKDMPDEIDLFYNTWRKSGIDLIRLRVECMIGNGLNKNRSTRNPCVFLYQGPQIIRYDGSLFPCPISWLHEPLGNLKNNTFLELWNSKKFIELRKNNISGKSLMCKNCPYPNPNMLLNICSFFFTSKVVRRLIPRAEAIAYRYKVPILYKVS